MDFFGFSNLYEQCFTRQKPIGDNTVAADKPTAIEAAVAAEARPEGRDWTRQLSESAIARRKFKLWEETQGLCIYCGKSIQADDFINGLTSDIEHIIPQRFGGRSVLDNITVACRVCNREKGDLTAIDYILSRPPEAIRDYFARIRMLATAGLITRDKYINLITPKHLIKEESPLPEIDQ